MASLGQLTLDLVAKIGGFTGPLENASRTSKREMSNIANSVKTASTAIAGIAATAAATSTAIVAFTNSAAQNAKEIKNQAQVSNTTTEEFQRLAYASNTVGVEQDKLSDILKDVNDKVGDFLSTGGGELADFFQKIAPQIGVTAEEFRNLSGPQALQKFYDGLEKANLSQSEMTFYMESVADEATALIPLLRNGGAGFAEMAAQADQLGIVLSDLDIAQLNEFANQFDRITAIFGSMANVLASELAPYLSVLADDLVEAASGANGLREALPAAIHDSVESIGPLLDAFRMVRLAVEGLQSVAASVSQAYAYAFLTIQDNATKMLDFVAGRINTIIAGINDLTGTDVSLIDSYNDSAYMDTLRQKYADVADFAKGQRDQVVELWNAPMPSTVIDDYLDRTKNKLAEIQSTVNYVPVKTLDEWLFKPSQSGGVASAALKDLEKSLSDAMSAFTGLNRQLSPSGAALAEYNDQISALDLLLDNGKINQLEYSAAIGAAAIEYNSAIGAANEYSKAIALVNQEQRALELQAQSNALAVAGVGMGDEELSRAQELLSIQQDYYSKAADLREQYNSGDITQQQYDEQLSIIEDFSQQAIEQHREMYEQMDAAQDDWANGASAAWANFEAEAENTAGNMQGVFSSALDGTADAIADFVTTGKLSFSDLANSILQDMARIAAQKAIVGMAGSIFGGSGDTGGSVEGLFASGGYVSGPGTGTSDSIPARLSNGEFVINAQSTAKNRPILEAINSGRGFANGGYVSSDGSDNGFTIASSSGSSSNSPAIHQTITVNGDASESQAARLQEAARQGAEQGYRLVLQDFQKNGKALQLARKGIK